MLLEITAASCCLAISLIVFLVSIQQPLIAPVNKLAVVVAIYSLLMAISQLAYVSEYFYAMNCAFLAVSSLLVAISHAKQIKVWPLCLLLISNDILIVVLRSQSISQPKPQDPRPFGDKVTLDLILVTGRLLLNIWISFKLRQKPYIQLADDVESQLQQSAFANFFVKLRKILPFMWPTGRPRLQFAIFGCVLMLICQRILNVLLPLTYRRIVNALNYEYPLSAILVYVLVTFLSGGNGLAYTIQSTMWIFVEQYTTKEVSCQMFNHLHALSLNWHLKKKTGEVLRIMDRGTSAISTLLSYVCFQIFPCLADIGIAIVFFIVQFDVYFGVIVFVTMFLYVFATIQLTEWRTQFRRLKNELENASNAKAVDSLLNFETVKYYGNEDYEAKRYEESINKFQRADWINQLSLRALNLSQNFVIVTGLLIGGLLCAKRVSEKQLTVGDFVLFISYLQQLYVPLNYFGSFFRAINQSFIDMEQMLKLFDEGREVDDEPDAKELVVTKAHIKFENVSFAYDYKKQGFYNVKNVSFEVLPGSTCAIVGETGASKSTLLRLLFRFYDMQEGRILIDGQDIRKVTQKSLRQAIGVVPQSCNLFNDTIAYNINYGKVEASLTDVEQNAKFAQIHEKILQFPDAYETMVGERGLRLSGGELQRVAIARTLLKNPSIVVLDEATSSLDTTTEAAIQQSLHDMTKNRSCLVVAHRLSTIVDADLILVMKEGQIVERGTHEELLQISGMYHQMWTKQSTKSRLKQA